MLPKPKSKPRAKDRKLTQKQRFIEAARAADIDETGEEFEREFKKIVPPNKPVSKTPDQK